MELFSSMKSIGKMLLISTHEHDYREPYYNDEGDEIMLGDEILVYDTIKQK